MLGTGRQVSRPDVARGGMETATRGEAAGGDSATRGGGTGVVASCLTGGWLGAQPAAAVKPTVNVHLSGAWIFISSG